MVVRGQLGISLRQVLNGGEGTVGVYRFCESGFKWW